MWSSVAFCGGCDGVTLTTEDTELVNHLQIVASYPVFYLGVCPSFCHH